MELCTVLKVNLCPYLTLLEEKTDRKVIKGMRDDFRIK